MSGGIPTWLQLQQRVIQSAQLVSTEMPEVDRLAASSLRGQDAERLDRRPSLRYRC